MMPIRKLTSLLPPVAALIAVAAAPTVARAHFLWTTVENGRARVALLEKVSDAPNAAFARYVEDVAPRAGGGKALSLGAVDGGARYADIPAGENLVTLESVIGVRERDGGGAYLLVYHASGAATPDAAAKGTGAPLEITARPDGEALIFSVLRDGAKVPGCPLWVQWPGQTEPTELKTGADGEVRVSRPVAASRKAGHVGARAMVEGPKPGEHANKAYAAVRRWATLTLPAPYAAPPKEDKFTRTLRASFGQFHETVSGAAFNETLFAGALTREQLLVHLQQRALVHNETHRVLSAAAPSLSVPYGPAQKDVLILLHRDLIALGSGWPTEPEARPLTRAFLKEIRESEKRGPYFALGVQHIYYGGITNGGRMIGQKIGETLAFTPTYYAESDGYTEYLPKVDAITDPAARREMIRGGQAAYRYIIASSNEPLFKAKPRTAAR